MKNTAGWHRVGEVVAQDKERDNEKTSTANERSEASLDMLRKIENDRDASLYKAVVGADCPTTIGCLGEGGECISRDRCFLSQRVRGESEGCRTNLCRNLAFCSPLCSIVGVRRLQSRGWL